MSAEVLRTFCHISEYDAEGYRNLHRMVAASDPLVLWAPSSQLLVNSSDCRLSGDDFLDYVEEGAIRIVGREEWLTDKSLRDAHPWPGAKWHGRVDEALLQMLKDDQREPDPQNQRVSVAPPERGDKQAEQISAEQPEAMAPLVKAFEQQKKANGVGPIPPGTFQTAARESETPEEAAKVVLRDAFNHAEAISLTGSETAILLSPPQGAFSQHVASIYTTNFAEPGGLSAAQADEVLVLQTLSGHLLGLLENLEIGGHELDLKEFMRGPGHMELVRWSREAMRHLVKLKPQQLKDALAVELRRQIEEGDFVRPSRRDGALGVAELVIGLLGLLEGSGPLAIAGLAFSTLPVAGEATRMLGFEPRQFTGPQWPFRYTWAAPASQAEHDAILRALDG